MRNTTSHLLCSLAAAAWLATAAHAQAPTESEPSTPTIKLTMDDRHVLKENLLKSAKSEGSAEQTDIERGSRVPASIPLQRFPDDIGSKIPQVRSHVFFVAGQSIVIVEPQQRTIVEVVK
jgi:hypothetical protein